MLTTNSYGTVTGQPPLLIVHGLFGSARNWGAMARRLADRGLVVVPDMRNHGDSPWADSQTYGDMAADLAELAVQHGPMDVLGHSMGGKAAMLLALTRPDLVARLIVADIAPVAYHHSHLPHIAAMRTLDIAGISTRGQADQALALAVADPGIRAFLLQSLDLKSDPHRWRLNLDVLARDMPHITGWPDVAGQYPGPALFLSGSGSDYVQPSHRAPIKALFPAARFAKIPDAGHWLHADQPRAFEATVRAFFSPPPSSSGE
jgi:esterase